MGLEWTVKTSIDIFCGILVWGLVVVVLVAVLCAMLAIAPIYLVVRWVTKPKTLAQVTKIEVQSVDSEPAQIPVYTNRKYNGTLENRVKKYFEDLDRQKGRGHDVNG